MSFIILTIFSFSIILGILGYITYFKEVVERDINPNRWSWLIWSLATLTESSTYFAVTNDLIKSTLFFIAGISCLLITWVIWSRSKFKKPTHTELTCIAISLVAIILLIFFEKSLIAHYLMLIGLPVAFIPTYISAWKNFKNEDCPSWMMWTISDALWLLFILYKLGELIEIPYAIIELCCHGTMWVILLYKKNAHKNIK